MPRQPPTTGAQTWQAQQKARSAGTLTNLGSSPSITVNAADGSGTLTTPTSVVSASQTGRTVTFTYTAAAGGINNGTVTLVVPSGWTAPSTTSNNAGYTTASAGTVSVASQTITVSSLTIAGGSTFTITYGDTSGGGTGATATATTGAQTWQAQSKSTAGGSLANLGASPSITVYAADGTRHADDSDLGRERVADRPDDHLHLHRRDGRDQQRLGHARRPGRLERTVDHRARTPATPTAELRHSLAVASQTITVSSLTLAGGATFTITYGSTASGGPGATATSSTGRADLAGAGEVHLRRLARKPRLLAEHHRLRRRRHGHADHTDLSRERVADRPHDHLHLHRRDRRHQQRLGHARRPRRLERTVHHRRERRLHHRQRRHTSPSPSQTITVSSLTIAGGSTFTITYGSTASGGPGATATSSTGAQTWQAQEKSTSAGSLANLGSSPSITVYAADGTGTLTTPTSVVSASQTGRTITFTYTAATGGINNGSVTLVVPAGWSAPSTTGANAGYSTSSAGHTRRRRARRSPSPR